MIYVVPEFTINEAITLENDLLTQIPDPDFTFDFSRVRNFDPFSTRMRRQTRSRRALSWTPNKNEYADNDYEKDRYRVTRRDASQERLNVLMQLLESKLNIILEGAPGVGKTFSARKLAYTIMGEEDDSRIEMVQFHQNYSYEDFVQGYRPDGADFKLTDGIFLRFCQLAANNPDG